MLDISLMQDAGVLECINHAQNLPDRCTREACNVRDNSEDRLVPVAMLVACHYVGSVGLKADYGTTGCAKARKYVRALFQLLKKEVNTTAENWSAKQACLEHQEVEIVSGPGG